MWLGHESIGRIVICVLFGGIAVACGGPLAWSQTYLYNEAHLTTGNSPAGVIVADVNGDGRPDLVESNFSDNTVSVLLGTAKGSFAAAQSYPTAAAPGALVAADFRGNGTLDLAVVDENAAAVSVLLGNGDGTFQGHVDYPVGYDPVGIVAADFNGDGKPDLGVVDLYGSYVAVLLNNGNGRFESQALVPLPGPVAIATADFNNDGRADLITSNSSGTVTVLLGAGDGSFTEMESQANGGTGLAVGDFDADGKMDVVVSNERADCVLLRGQGDGTFASPITLQDTGSHFAAAADLNHDGNLDLALSGGIILLGNGNGTFQPPVSSPDLATSFAIADLNGDGQMDLVGIGMANAVEIKLGSGGGTLGSISQVNMAPPSYLPVAAAAGDFNQDGKLDLAMGLSGSTGEIAIALNKGGGKFKKPVVSSLGATATFPQFVYVADFNGDGKPDVMAEDDYGNGFQVLLGKGDGHLQPAVDTSVSGVQALGVGDLNQDGKSDVVEIGNNGSAVATVYLSNGDGTFDPGAQYTLNNYNVRITIADVNHDGKPDLLLVGNYSPLQVFLGHGDGTFASPLTGPTDTYIQTPAVADFDGDGKVDIAVGTQSGMAFLAGNGDGTFQPAVYSDQSFQFSAGALTSGDFNGDGKPDLLSYPVDFTLGAAVIVGNGDGTFLPPATYNSLLFFGGFVGADFNGDHVSDVYIAGQDPSTGVPVAYLYLSIPTPYIFPTALNLGKEAVGQTSKPKKVKLQNRGNAKLRISGISATGDFLQENDCGEALAIGKGCTVQVTFKPTAKGIRHGALVIKDNAAASPQKISLRGTGQ